MDFRPIDSVFRFASAYCDEGCSESVKPLRSLREALYTSWSSDLLSIDFLALSAAVVRAASISTKERDLSALVSLQPPFSSSGDGQSSNDENQSG